MRGGNAPDKNVRMCLQARCCGRQRSRARSARRCPSYHDLCQRGLSGVACVSVCVCLCVSIFGTYTAASDVKKTFTLPRTMMTNSDLARIINSDEIQTKVSSFPQPSLLPCLLAFAPARRGRVLPWSDMSAGICCLSLPSSPTLLPALLRLPLCGAQVRDARAGFAKPSRKRNPLKNLGSMLKLNPYIAQVFCSLTLTPELL